MKIIGSIHKVTDNGILIICEGDRAAVENRIRKYGRLCEVNLLDGRIITEIQRKKIFATIDDIASFSGEVTFFRQRPTDSMKLYLKAMFIESYQESKNYGMFSLSNCSRELATDYIDWLINFCFEQNIPTMETLAARYDDIDRYMYACLKHRKCAVCNEQGEEHHIDVIGMGNNRRKLDDSQHMKICLCRKHHTEVETIGWQRFEERYHVKGILFNEADRAS